MAILSFTYNTPVDSSSWEITMDFPLLLTTTDQDLIDLGEELNRDDLLGTFAGARNLNAVSLSGLGRQVYGPIS